MKNIDSYYHVRGESVYVDDIKEIEGTSYAYLFTSPSAHGVITNLNVSKAKKSEGVIAVFTSKDIPGVNEIGRIIQDEPLFAEKEVHFQGQPIAMIVAHSIDQARVASNNIVIQIEEKLPITDPRDAFKRGLIIGSPRTFETGNIDRIWQECTHIVEDTVEISGQEHIYIETQGSYAVPKEKGLTIYSSTQGPTAIQKTMASILNIPMHEVEVDVRRLGGAFGGKEDQATVFACAAGLAAYQLNRPVKLILERDQDIKITGKRHPYQVDYKIGFDLSGKILGYEAVFYQNAGAAADLSPAVLERTLFHTNNAYFIPNAKITAYSCKTNLPPNTAFRGFGGPQGMFVIEAALYKAAKLMRIESWKLQRINLLKESDIFPYGQSAKNIHLRAIWDKLEELYEFDEILNSVRKFNEKKSRYRKGLAIMPVCFGIAFTSTFMNQASALVHVYSDGSVGVSTAAVEMGQGVNTRIAQVPLKIFSISPNRIKIETTNTTRVANTSPSAASSTHDLNGKATELACRSILHRIKSQALVTLNLSDVDLVEIIDEAVFYDGERQDLSWEELVLSSFLNRVDLSEHSFYATPNIYFDKNVEKGAPFAYHAIGVGIIQSEVDILTGTYKIESVKVVHDFGKSMNPIIDLGQMEGGIVQGIGWMTSEELRYNSKGVLLSNSLSTYKVPDIYAAPKEIKVHFLEHSENELGLYKSKAIGEPPLMYGIGAYFSLLNAIESFKTNPSMKIISPMTPERVLFGLYSDEDVKSKKIIEAKTTLN